MPLANEDPIIHAYRALNEKKYAEAINLYKISHENGNANAALYLGYMTQRGLGVPVDLSAATEYFEEARGNGMKHAQSYLARNLFKRKLYDLSYKEFADLSKKGVNSANFWLYVHLRNGFGTKIDLVTARQYLETAAKGGHVFALRDLSKNYIKGDYGIANIPRGCLMLIKASGKYITTEPSVYSDDSLF